jgi:hypothetical protein
MKLEMSSTGKSGKSKYVEIKNRIFYFYFWYGAGE